MVVDFVFYRRTPQLPIFVRRVTTNYPSWENGAIDERKVLSYGLSDISCANKIVTH